MTSPSVSYKRHRFPPAIIAHAVWLHFRFPLSLRLVEEMLLERGIVVSNETVRRWAMKFGRDYARRLKRKRASRRDIWHLDEIVVSIGGKQHWLWRAVDQDGYILDEIVQARRDTSSKALADASSQEAGLSAQAHDYRQARLLCRSPAPDQPGRSAAALASNANEGARWVHQRIAQRSLLARRTPDRVRRPRGCGWLTTKRLGRGSRGTGDRFSLPALQ